MRPPYSQVCLWNTVIGSVTDKERQAHCRCGSVTRLRYYFRHCHLSDDPQESQGGSSFSASLRSLVSLQQTTQRSLATVTMPFRQAAKRIELTVATESLLHYYGNISKQIDSLGFEDVSVTQRHGIFDGASRFEICPVPSPGISSESVITAYQEYRITTVVQDMSYQASLKARRMGKRVSKIRMKVTPKEMPREPESAWSPTTVSDAGSAEAVEGNGEAGATFGIAH